MSATEQLPTLVLIEDDDMISQALVRALASVFEVRRARNLREGLALIDEGGFAALLCDWNLGDGTGDVALARSTERRRD